MTANPLLNGDGAAGTGGGGGGGGGGGQVALALAAGVRMARGEGGGGRGGSRICGRWRKSSADTDFLAGPAEKAAGHGPVRPTSALH